VCCRFGHVRSVGRPNSTSREPVGASRHFAVTTSDLVIQSWQGPSEMVIEIEFTFDGHLDEGVLARAADLILDAEPILGCRLVSPSGAMSTWGAIACSR